MPGRPSSLRRVSDVYIPTSAPLPVSGSLPVPLSTTWICHAPLTRCASLSDAVSRSKYDTIGTPSAPTAMLVYIPTSGPLSLIPPRIFEPGTITGPAGTPSTHSQAVSGIRPPVVRATTRSPWLCAYAETQMPPSGATATSEYGPIRPARRSGEQAHALSTQKCSCPVGHGIVQSAIDSHAAAGAAPQLQPG